MHYICVHITYILSILYIYQYVYIYNVHIFYISQCILYAYAYITYRHIILYATMYIVDIQLDNSIQVHTCTKVLISHCEIIENYISLFLLLLIFYLPSQPLTVNRYHVFIKMKTGKIKNKLEVPPYISFSPQPGQILSSATIPIF